MSPSDVFEPAEFASVFFFLFLCKKGERKKGSSECGPSLLKNNAAEARACKPGVPTCVFLSEKSTLLRVRGAMPWARIFFVCGRPQKATWAAGDGPAADGPRATRAKSLRAEQHGRSDTRGVREKGKKDVFSFSRGKDRRAFAYPLGVGRDRGAAIAALGIGTAVKTMRARVAARGGKPSLWRPVDAEPSVSSL